jgi:hypothetical protein
MAQQQDDVKVDHVLGAIEARIWSVWERGDPRAALDAVGVMVAQLDEDQRAGHVTADHHEGMSVFYEELAMELITCASE